MMKISVKNLLAGIFILACVLFVSIVYYNGWRERKSLKDNVEYTEGLVLRISRGVRAGRYIDYEYVVDGKKYESKAPLRSKRVATFSGSPIIVGNTCTVAYDQTNPQNSTIYKF
jgi:lipoprotein